MKTDSPSTRRSRAAVVLCSSEKNAQALSSRLDASGYFPFAPPPARNGRVDREIARQTFTVAAREYDRVIVIGDGLSSVAALLLAEEYVLDGIILLDPPEKEARFLQPRPLREAWRNLFAIAAPILVFYAAGHEADARRILSGVSSRISEMAALSEGAVPARILRFLQEADLLSLPSFLSPNKRMSLAGRA